MSDSGPGLQGLSRYGMMFASYRGTGRVQIPGDDEHEARFVVAQREDGTIFLECELPELSRPVLNSALQIGSIQGALDDGRPVVIDQVGVIRESAGIAPVTIVSMPGRFTVGAPDWLGPGTITFTIVNFPFLGTEAEEFEHVGGWSVTSSLLPLNLGPRRARLRWIPGYSRAEEDLRTLREPRITCTASFQLSAASELDNAVQDIQDLCDVMTVAKGALANWLCYEVADSHARPLYAFHRNAVTSRYSSNSPLPLNLRDEVPRFLERGFLELRALSDTYRIREVCHAFADTRTAGFIETRGLAVISIVEYLAGVAAGLHEQLTYLPLEEFNASLPDLTSELRQLLSRLFPRLETNARQAMSAKAQSINYTSVRSRLRTLGRTLRMDVADQEIDEFLNVRNELVHRMRFPGQRPAAASFMMIQHFLDKVMLRLLGYEGPYWDVEAMRYSHLRAT